MRRDAHCAVIHGRYFSLATMKSLFFSIFSWTCWTTIHFSCAYGKIGQILNGGRITNVCLWQQFSSQGRRANTLFQEGMCILNVPKLLILLLCVFFWLLSSHCWLILVFFFLVFCLFFSFCSGSPRCAETCNHSVVPPKNITWHRRVIIMRPSSLQWQVGYNIKNSRTWMTKT